MTDSRTAGPSWWYFVLGGVVLLAGMGGFLKAIVYGVFHVTDNLIQIVVPGSKDLTLKPNLSYTIFLETESVVDGRIYSTENLSGLSCEVASKASGKKLNTYRPSGSTTYSVSGREGRSVFEFATEEAGVYSIACGYADGHKSPQAVIAVGSGVGGRIFSLVLQSFAWFFGGVIFGGGIIALVAILRDRARRVDPPVALRHE